MTALNKRFKVCIVLFAIALSIAVLSFIGAVLMAYSKNYPPAFVLAAISLICFYAAPIYYSNAASSKAFAKIIVSLEDGADTLDKLANSTGIRRDACEKLFGKAVLRGFIKDFEISEGNIVKK